MITQQLELKDKAGVVIIVDHSRDYTAVYGVYTFFIFFSFDLRNYTFQPGFHMIVTVGDASATCRRHMETTTAMII